MKDYFKTRLQFAQICSNMELVYECNVDDMIKLLELQLDIYKKAKLYLEEEKKEVKK